MVGRARDTVLVWDGFVRVFHWGFAALVVCAWLTHDLPRQSHIWHQVIGYCAVTLVILRILWGFFGTRYARFSAWLPGPRRLVSYLGDLAGGKEKRHLSHNPLGALMVLLLMGLSIGLAVTGYAMSQRMTLFGISPRNLVGVHAFFANTFLWAVPLHVVGVIFESARQRENLAAAMITGRKRAENAGDEKTPLAGDEERAI